ncbi:hypothetical protein OO013_15370 [Mangrovivirga sp. M17]|uniref:Lipoprotein n=1 Tax=Mangrovivirga halotolerans TaxID=2993936 RepID=A0ABT3RUL4_9BACT|nr:hypothetical protein [Mangrovivirga halotolerans]MCX2745257.1 hypothetical protein [Mangrovivirga halotolerans]
MKLNTRKLQLLFLAIALVMSITSCQESETVDSTDQKSALSAEGDFEEQYMDLDQVIYDAFDINGMGPANGRVVAVDKNQTTLKCAQVTWNHNTETGEGTFTIDFGTEGCEGPYGRVRKGVVNISYTGGYWEAGSIITTTVEQYFVNDIQIEGTRVVENITNGGMPTFKISLTNGKLTFMDGNVATRTSTRFRIYDFNNLEMKIYGTANGVNRLGTFYDIQVSADSPIVFAYGCQPNGKYFPVSGVKTISRVRANNELSDFVVDYGQGECDSKVFVSTDKWSGEITIN